MSSTHDPSSGVVHEVRWSEALPWWLLFRAAGAAFSPTVIILAALGAVATGAGWTLLDQLGLRAAGAPTAADDLVLPAVGVQHTAPAAALPASLAPSHRAVPWVGQLAQRLPATVAGLVSLVTLPFRPSASLADVGAAAARVGWFVLVWSIFGTAIARRVALKLVGEDAPGIVGAIWFGTRKWVAAFNSVLFVLLGIAALSIPGCLLGLLMRTDWGLACAGAVWPLVLLGAVVLAILAIGVAAGWPLMVACVGVERGDSFQAISTAFSYLYQRPLHYAFYAVVALAVAVPATVIAAMFADATATLAMWAASFGMGHERTAAVLGELTAPGGDGGPWGVAAIRFWCRGLETLLASFGWGYGWAIATAAYLLLRQSVDGTELDEVVLDEPGADAAG
jgi:hypothetical protein